MASNPVATGTLTPTPPDIGAETRLSSDIPPGAVPDTETRLSTPVRAGIPARTLQPGHPFGPRYRILKVLGQGGMGVVYQAWDEELGLAVALKTIRPEVMSDPINSAEIERRFKRELLLARQVTHRHVVRIHDLGEVDGVKYLTMPFIEGQTLTGLLLQSGKLSVGRALQIFREIADGLAAAHAAGVVHRDLKPDNVMLDADGHAVIMDFGISRSLTGTGAGTMMGSVVGTLEYMSPEQAKGEVADQRADIYALGLILYDMLVGRRRLTTGTNPMSEAMARMQHAPTPVRALDASVPEPVERIVARCLEPGPAMRYQTVADLVTDLDRLDPDGHEPVTTAKPWWMPGFAVAWSRAARLGLLAALGLALIAPAVMLGMLVANRRAQPAPADAAREPLSILIADFQNLANDPVFEGSLEQALAIAMEGAPFITTFPRRDAMATARSVEAGSGEKLDEATARLVSQREGIKVVLAGSVAGGDHYTIEVRALEPFGGKMLTRASREASGKPQVLQAVAQLASDVREALGDVTPESERLADAETFTSASLEAARDYAMGQHLSSNGRYEESITYFKRAIDADPNFGRAYATWAVGAFALGRHAEAEQLYQRAFTLLHRMTKREEYRTLGTYYLAVARDYQKAAENFARLVERYPADRGGHSNLALSYFYLRNFPKALEHGRRATEIYGTSPKFRSNNALYAMYAGDFKTAAEDASRLIKDHPTYYRAYFPIAMAAIADGRREEIAAAYQNMARVGGPQGTSLADMGLADLAMYYGEYADAIRVLEPAIARDEQIKNPLAMAVKLMALAEARFAAGDTARAIGTARKAAASTEDLSVLVPAARLFVAAGRTKEAAEIAAKLDQRLQPMPRAYGKMIAGEMALAQHRYAEALDALGEARRLADLWLIKFVLGVANVRAGQHPAAKQDLEDCLAHRGEATAVFLDDVPSIRYLAPVHYWLGRALEGIGSTDSATASYKTFLTLRPGAADALSADARRRLPSATR